MPNAFSNSALMYSRESEATHTDDRGPTPTAHLAVSPATYLLVSVLLAADALGLSAIRSR